MKDPKEVLRKIAEALNIAAPATTENEAPEAVAAPEVVTPEPEAVAAPEPVVTPEVAAEPVAEVVPEPVAPVISEREAELEASVVKMKEDFEKQIAELKGILQAAVEPEAPEAPEVPVAPLVHNPEAPLKSKAKGIGKKGTSIQERVYKYINN